MQVVYRPTASESGPVRTQLTLLSHCISHSAGERHIQRTEHGTLHSGQTSTNLSLKIARGVSPPHFDQCGGAGWGVRPAPLTCSYAIQRIATVIHTLPILFNQNVALRLGIRICPFNTCGCIQTHHVPRRPAAHPVKDVGPVLRRLLLEPEPLPCPRNKRPLRDPRFWWLKNVQNRLHGRLFQTPTAPPNDQSFEPSRNAPSRNEPSRNATCNAKHKR
jgi:hypothetical protein